MSVKPKQTCLSCPYKGVEDEISQALHGGMLNLKSDENKDNKEPVTTTAPRQEITPEHAMLVLKKALQEDEWFVDYMNFRFKTYFMKRIRASILNAHKHDGFFLKIPKSKDSVMADIAVDMLKVYLAEMTMLTNTESTDDNSN